MKLEIMVLDEPTAGLDPEGVTNLIKLLRELNDEGIIIIISTHDIDLSYGIYRYIAFRCIF